MMGNSKTFKTHLMKLKEFNHTVMEMSIRGQSSQIVHNSAQDTKIFKSVSKLSFTTFI